MQVTIALVCDWLTTYGGAEHVLRALCKMWPDAPLFTSVYHPSTAQIVECKDIRPSALQCLFRLLRRHQPLLPLLPRAMESLDVRGYDVIISSSHAVGKGSIPAAGSLHICYCHTPMRYAWEMEEEYLRDSHLPWPLTVFARKELKKIRRWDLATALRTDYFIANSRETQERIRRIYGRESVVISPPVDDRFLQHDSPPERRDAYLAIGRLVPYKRFDLLIHLANALKFPLVIAGKGQDEKRLRSLAGPTVTFAGYVSDDMLPGLYSRARALLFPQYEDAGIVPLEAQACGTPVIAYGKGGVLDTVIENVTGIFVPEQTVESFRDALVRFERMSWSSVAMREHAALFSYAKFAQRMRTYVDEKVQDALRHHTFVHRP